MLGQAKTGRAARTGTGATAARAAPGQGVATLRDALRSHPAGPELLAVAGALADRPLPDGWTQWDARRWDAYLDEVLVEARTQRGGVPVAERGVRHN
jgi:hypothetical protein